jgi:hypothetical protein
MLQPRLEWKLRGDCGAKTGHGLDVELAADHFDALSHADQPQPLVPSRIQRVPDVE